MLVLEFKVKKLTTRQREKIDEQIRTTQFIRNKCIRFWIDAPKAAKINGYALNKYSTQLRKEFPFVRELDAMACQAASERSWTAIARFYENCKKGKPGRKGFPKFQRDCRSVEYKTSGWLLYSNKRWIKFNSLGTLKLLGSWDIHKYPKESIKRVRLLKRADGYYVQFVIDQPCEEFQPPTGKQIGIDVGLTHFYTDSNGHHEPNPKFLKKSLFRIKHFQRSVSKKVKKSNNRRKAIKILGKLHLRVSRQRVEHAKRLARNLCKSNDLVAYEDLKISNMLKCHNRARSISDASWYQFRQWLEHFARKFNRIAIAVNPHNTSQNCCGCGVKVPKTLKDKIHDCHNCGLKLDRDINAAINILLRARSTVGHTGSNALGDGASTLLGATLVKQVLSMIKESSLL